MKIDVTRGKKSKRLRTIEQYLTLTVLNKSTGLLKQFSNDCRK